MWEPIKGGRGPQDDESKHVNVRSHKLQAKCFKASKTHNMHCDENTDFKQNYGFLQ